MKTKAELEAEIEKLKLEIAGLKAAVAAYQFALEQVGKSQTYYPSPADAWVWPPAAQPSWYPNPSATPPFQITS